jgi:hypothetical protein
MSGGGSFISSNAGLEYLVEAGSIKSAGKGFGQMG